ncbi:MULTISPECIES: metal-sulfur cluster assembly factor [Actinomadura]|uniref:metal-sulfur cluster assembly factor n=1 Tax=Actinomadura TaxID=1988 RepID=UPI0003ACE7F3|nr:metal-sulfur cluster assembly factor [Actinomadura madurae]SPT58053.1 FeS assembly SUF system protein [Actinomadura madurae]
MITIDEVRAALRGVADPCAIATGAPVDIVDMGLIQGIDVTAGAVTVTLRLTSPFCMQIGLMSEQIGKALRRLPDVADVRVEVDHLAEWMPEMMDPQAQERLRRIRPLGLVAR